MSTLHVRRYGLRHRLTGTLTGVGWSLVCSCQLLLTAVLTVTTSGAARGRRQGEAGGITAEYVLVTAFIVGIVAAVALVFKDKILAAVNAINFTTP